MCLGPPLVRLKQIEARRQLCCAQWPLMARSTKRPAAATQGGALKKSKPVEFATDMRIVNPLEMIAELCHVGGYSPLSVAAPFRWASAFDGANLPAFALEMLRVNGQHICGSEKALAPACFAMMNLPDKKRHIFEAVRAKSK